MRVTVNDDLSKEKNLKVAARQVERLTRLIDDLLDVSRFTAGRLRIEPRVVDLVALVRQVVAHLADEADRARCQITVSADGPVMGRWDPERLEQVVENLLSNAMKFGTGKPVEVVVSKVGSSARLVVRDQGIGILPEARARIFERFERSVSPRHFGGLGLGLYIVNQIVTAHAGKIAVVSEPGAGAAFTVELPSELPNDKEEMSAGSESASAPA